MIRFLALTLSLFSVAHADECPLPQITFGSTPREDASFDVRFSRELVEGLIGATEHDRERARVDRLTVGAEVATLGRDGDDRLASYEVLSLAIRLRQLDCAVWSGRVATPAPLYRALADDARALLAQLGGTAPPPSNLDGSGWRLPPPKPVARQEVVNPAKRALHYRAGGGVLLVGGVAFLAGALALTIEVARYQAPPPCGADSFLCFNDLSEAFHQISIVSAVGLWVIGAAATVAGAVLVNRGNRWAEKARLTPSLAVGPNGGVAGLRLSF